MADITEDAAEDALRAVLATVDDACARHGMAGVTAAQFKFVVAIHTLATVAQRAGLTKEYVASRVGVMLPRAMDAAEGDQHIDLHRGSVPS